MKKLKHWYHKQRALYHTGNKLWYEIQLEESKKKIDYHVNKYIC